jgi:feruloyl-CoA synthase
LTTGRPVAQIVVQDNKNLRDGMPGVSGTTRSADAAPLRAVKLGVPEVHIETRTDGAILVRAAEPLGSYHDKLSQPLERWAREAPDRVFLAERNERGWRRLSYAETLETVKRIGAALLRRGLSTERPIAILSGNSIDHALLGLAAAYVGIPFAPISPAYSLLSGDFGKLKTMMQLLTPRMVYASDGLAFARAIAACTPVDAELVVSRNAPSDRKATMFADLMGPEDAVCVGAANATITPDTIVKFLFTSGSTGTPKAVINTQRMLCSNQAMIASGFRFVVDEPPVVVDWLPWSHTFGGNHNFYMVLTNGGSLYIDDGNPTPAGTPKTARNLGEVGPTIYFNVPKGYEALLPHLCASADLRKNFFSRLKVLFYAGAGLSQAIRDQLTELAVATIGERIIFLSSLGSTETSPLALACTWDFAKTGNIGLPCPGVELKLVPCEGKFEARLRGPNITPGYWRQPELTRQAFDEEGFYRIGDALRFADPADPFQGLLFDGRIAEDFKLSTGTWVSVGPLRARFIDHFAPYVRDVVFTGLDRDFIGALVFPEIEACRRLACLPAAATPEQVVAAAAVRRTFAELMRTFAATATGSSTRIERALLMSEPPSMDKGEATDKGSINQRAVLANRSELAEVLYRDPPEATVIVP